MSEAAVVAATASCALCRAPLAEGPSAHVNSHPVCASCLGQVESEVAAQTPRGASFAVAAAAGLAGALAGALVWTVIAVSADAEIGFVAVLVGFLAGVGVKKGARLARGQSLQILAAVLAIVGLFVAKYMIVAYTAVKVLGDKGMSIGYLDPKMFHMFFGVLGKIITPFDALWLFLAVGAAYRVPAARRIHIARA